MKNGFEIRVGKGVETTYESRIKKDKKVDREFRHVDINFKNKKPEKKEKDIIHEKHSSQSQSKGE